MCVPFYIINLEEEIRTFDPKPITGLVVNQPWKLVFRSPEDSPADVRIISYFDYIKPYTINVLVNSPLSVTPRTGEILPKGFVDLKVTCRLTDLRPDTDYTVLEVVFDKDKISIPVEIEYQKEVIIPPPKERQPVSVAQSLLNAIIKFKL